MTDAQRIYLNDFFVHVFNRILVWEEHALSQVGAQDLSVKELHVLEAVSDLTVQARNTMTAIAEALSIRVSSLTTAVNTLVRKGYLEPGRRAGGPAGHPGPPHGQGGAGQCPPQPVPRPHDRQRHPGAH